MPKSILMLFFCLQQAHAYNYYLSTTVNSPGSNSLSKSNFNPIPGSISADDNSFKSGTFNNIVYAPPSVNSTTTINRTYSDKASTDLSYTGRQTNYSLNKRFNSSRFPAADTTAFKFYYNYTDSSSSVHLSGLWKDVQDSIYRGTLKLKPHTGIVLIYYASNPDTAATTCSATGTILREQWNNVAGTNISDIPLQTVPSSTSQLTSFEGPVNIADNYGSRISGYICPPQTGSYTFWIAGDDASELWLSTDDNPANKVRIANVDDWTSYREWNKYASQKSVTINLQAGKKYYVEALEKEGGGDDNLSVQWELPDGSVESPIAGSHLSPYNPEQQSTILSVNKTILPLATVPTDTASPIVKTGLFVYPNPVSQQATVEFALAEKGQTAILLFNTKGQFISKLFTGTSEPNTKNSFVFNAEMLQSGVYVIQLISGKNSFSKRIIVVK